jgi:hypothetical protein
MQQRLSDIITLKRRYLRAINLERDLSVIDSVLGYIPTAWTLEVTDRILTAFSTPHSIKALSSGYTPAEAALLWKRGRFSGQTFSLKLMGPCAAPPGRRSLRKNDAENVTTA